MISDPKEIRQVSRSPNRSIERTCQGPFLSTFRRLEEA